MGLTSSNSAQRPRSARNRGGLTKGDPGAFSLLPPSEKRSLMQKVVYLGKVRLIYFKRGINETAMLLQFFLRYFEQCKMMRWVDECGCFGL